MSTSLKSEMKNNDPWQEILSPKNEDEAIEMDAQMLMFRFLSEIERFQELQGVSRKNLAEKTKTSPSYITQLFRGDKPLNFSSIAKMQKALNIVFEIKAKSAKELCTTCSPDDNIAPVISIHDNEQHLLIGNK